MIEATAELLRTPLLVIGASGFLIGVGLLISDKRRYLGRTPRSDQPEGDEQESQR